MQLIPGKCPYCGANLKINDQAKGELMCPYCGSTYIVEQAINYVNVSNSVVNHIYASNVNVSGFDEKNEIIKARKLIGKDNNLASKVYNTIFENNAQNFEAEYLRIILNNDTKIVTVTKDEFVYNSILKMNLLEKQSRQETQPVYTEQEKQNAKINLLKKAVAENFEELIPVLKSVYTISDLVSGKIDFSVYDFKGSFVYYLDYTTAYKAIIFLYSFEESKKGVLQAIELSYNMYNEYGDTYYLDRLNYQEKIMLLLDSTYQKRAVEPKKASKQNSYSLTDTNSLSMRAFVAGFRIFLLLLFFMTVAKSKTHGISYPGSYSDMTVKISMYKCIFGYKDIYGTISGSGLMKIGFFANIAAIVCGFIYVSKPSKIISIVNIILSIITAICLSPIGINAGIREYNSTAGKGSYYNHSIKISGTGIFLFIFIVMVIVELVAHYYYTKEKKS